MRFGLAVACALWASQAGAVTYVAQMTGTLTQQYDTSFNDSLMSLGETITLSARFDDSQIYDEFVPPPGPGDIGSYQMFAHAPYGPTGESFFRIDSANFTWSGYDDRLGGAAYPWIEFEGGKVKGLWGSLLEADSSAKPGIDMYGARADIVAGNNVDLNNYVSPGFKITWDFGSSYFGPAQANAVPEPATWLSMLSGFTLLGLAFRRRRGVILAHA